MTQYKMYTVESKAVEGEPNTYELMASTEGMDRDGDILLATGAELDNFRRNPVVPFAHQYDKPPVARAVNIEAIPGAGLKAKIQFPKDGDSPEADVIHRLWDSGFLNAASVGFIPKQAQPLNETGQGRIFTQWELLEFSLVAVPAQANALRLAVKSLDMADIEQKRGRVLSAANEGKLRAAYEAIGEVLSKLESAPDTEEGKALDDLIGKPYPNEHACRLREPGDFQPDSFRRMSREHEGKQYDVIMGKLKNETSMSEQAYRYPKDTWTADAARAHCSSHDGSFEAAARRYDPAQLSELSAQLAGIRKLYLGG